MTDLKDISILDLAPHNIAADGQVKAMAAGLDPELQDTTANIAAIEIYKNIDTLPEPVLRLLAWENRVFGREWQLAGTLAARRQLVKDSFILNLRRGTRWSVERVFELVGINATIFEWFEYGGDPYHFQITIGQGQDLTQEQIDLALEMVDEYKPLRAWLESVGIIVEAEGDAHAYVSAANTMSLIMDTYP